MKFEEQFPELSKITHLVEHINDKFSADEFMDNMRNDVQKHCLSKQKFKEALKKLILYDSHHPMTILMHNCMIHELIDKLGLDTE